MAQKNMIYDVAVIGAGPAGSMLARLLQNKSIALIDARPMDRAYKSGDRLKSCGGLIAPDAQKFLRQQKIKIPSDIIDPMQPTKGVKTTDFDTKLIRYYKRNYINVNREAFDRFLLEDVKADTYFETLVNSITDNTEYFTINKKIKAKIIVGADGAGSIVRRQFFPDFKPRTYVSIQEVFEKKSFEFECFFDKEMSDYYGWALPKGRNTLLGYAIPQGNNCRAKFDNFKIKLGYKKAASQEGTLIIRPNFIHPVICNNRVFLIGEAGGYISPSSAEGISYAFRSAKYLAESNFEVKFFKRKMLKIQIDIFYKSLKSILMYTPIIRHLIMRLTPQKKGSKHSL